jgi:hypothetical protein
MMFKKMTSSRSLFSLLAVAALVLSACGKDKTLDEYQRERLQENLSVYQSVAGSYTGIVQSTQSHKSLGAMQIDLRAETKVDGSPSGSDSALGKPTLVTNVRFLDETVISFSASSSYYDQDTGAYNAQITILRESGEGETIALSGFIRNGQISGEIATTNFPGYGGSFVLQKDGKPLGELGKARKPDDLNTNSPTRQLASYDGVTTFSDGSKKQVRIVALTPVRGTAEDFLDIISPRKQVQLSFNYSQSLNLLFSSAIFDLKQGQLTGKLYLKQGGEITQQMNLECLIVDAQISCQHVTTGSGVTASTKAEVPNGQAKPLPKDADEQKAMTARFKGKGVMAGRTRKMTMQVIKPSRGRMQDLMELFFPTSEKLINLSVEISEAVSVSFMNIKWDASNGIIDGAQAYQDYTAYIQCSEFFFRETKHKFKCNYWSSRSPNIPMEFNP